MKNFNAILQTECSEARQMFQHLGTRRSLAAVGRICCEEPFSGWMLPVHTRRQGILLFVSVRGLLCERLDSFQNQNPDSAPRLLYFMFVWFFIIFSLQNSPGDIPLSKLNCI